MKHYRFEAAIVAAAIVLLGAFFYWGLKSLTAGQRTVSVRGLAERTVKADYVTWPIVYRTTGGDLQALYTDINTAVERIKTFLTENGIKAEDISVKAPEITDLKAERYAADAERRDRYTTMTVVVVATTDVDAVGALMPRVGELLKSGVAITEGGYGNSVQYEFRGLNDIKPQMIEEATRAARAAAEKFAKDSESSLGKIKQAQQGLFSINDRDQHSPHIKQVRVVTTVDYYLNS